MFLILIKLQQQPSSFLKLKFKEKSDEKENSNKITSAESFTNFMVIDERVLTCYDFKMKLNTFNEPLSSPLSNKKHYLSHLSHCLLKITFAVSREQPIKIKIDL